MLEIRFFERLAFDLPQSRMAELFVAEILFLLIVVFFFGQSITIPYNLHFETVFCDMFLIVAFSEMEIPFREDVWIVFLAMDVIYAFLLQTTIPVACLF